jgi:hypothetical protein
MFKKMGDDEDEAGLMAVKAEKAVMFLHWANSKSYKVVDSLSNQYLRDQTGYPWTLDEAFGLLSDWADSEHNRGGAGRDCVSFIRGRSP